MGKQQTILAIEHDGMNIRAICIHLTILSDNPDFNIEAAVINACTEYMQTPDGRKTYEHNCGCFNWADFASDVPNEICRRHGFEKADQELADKEVDWDQHLVDDSRLEEE